MNDALLQHLRTRRTVPALQLGSPGPDETALADILTIAARVPDHGKLAPWRFIVYRGYNRAVLADGLRAIARRTGDDLAREKQLTKVDVFAHSPVIVGVVSKPTDSEKVPEWEQQLSAAAVCMNAIHATHGHGFSGQWLTEWYAYEDDAAQLLGAGERERFAGFIHMGTPTLPPAERERPQIDAIMSVWTQQLE